MNFFQNMISSIMKRTLRLDSLGLKDFGVLHKDLNKTTESIMSTTGELSTLVYSEHLLDMLERQDDSDLLGFLRNLVANYDIDTDLLVQNTKSYAVEKNQKSYKKLCTFYKKRSFNNTYGFGYRIQLYNGNEQKAKSFKARFNVEFPGNSSKLIYNTPEWKVQVGNYKTKLEADKDLVKFQKKFSGIIVIPMGK